MSECVDLECSVPDRSVEVGAAGSHQPVLDQRDDGEQQHQRDREGGGVAELQPPEGQVVDVELEHVRRARRAAVPGGDGDRVEDLERADHGDDQHQCQDRPQQRHGHRPEQAPFARAVHPPRLVHRLRQRLQAGEDQQRGVAHVPPDVDECDRRDRPVRVGEERDPSDAQPLQHLVADAEPGVEDPQPDDAGDDVRHEVRSEYHAAQEGGAGEAVHQHGDQQCHGGLHTDVDDDVLDGDPQRVPEDGVADHPPVVVEPGPPGCAQQAELGEAEVDPAQGRPQQEGEVAQQRRCEKECRDAAVAAAFRGRDRCGWPLGASGSCGGDGHERAPSSRLGATYFCVEVNQRSRGRDRSIILRVSRYLLTHGSLSRGALPSSS